MIALEEGAGPVVAVIPMANVVGEGITARTGGADKPFTPIPLTRGSGVDSSRRSRTCKHE